MKRKKRFDCYSFFFFVDEFCQLFKQELFASLIQTYKNKIIELRDIMLGESNQIIQQFPPNKKFKSNNNQQHQQQQRNNNNNSQQIEDDSSELSMPNDANQSQNNNNINNSNQNPNKKQQSTWTQTIVNIQLEKTKWDEIAGLIDAKSTIREALVLPRKFPHFFNGKDRNSKRKVLLEKNFFSKTKKKRESLGIEFCYMVLLEQENPNW